MMLNPLLIVPFALWATIDSPDTGTSGGAAYRDFLRDEFPHEDPRVGFKMSTPKKWNQIPIQNDERWIVGRYQSDKANHYTDKTFGWTFDHKPELTMIAFSGETMRTDIDPSNGRQLASLEDMIEDEE